MNPRYLETYRRHRALFLLLIACSVAVATWFAVGEPKMYRATVTLWSAGPDGSSQDAIGAPPPAAQEQQLLNELLTTHYVRERVARRAELVGYLRRHGVEGWGPSALVARLRGPGTLDARIEAALGPKRVTSVVQGPHVLEIAYDAPSPELALAMVRSLVAEFRHQRVALRRDALSAYREQVRAASTALVKARATLRQFLRTHPGASVSPQLAALARAERNAVERLADAAERLDTAPVDASASTPPATSLRVIDRPKLPTGPTTGRQAVVVGVLAGLFVGMLVSALGILALTTAGDFLRRVEEPPREPSEDADERRLAERDDDRPIAEPFAERLSRWAGRA
jgi:hypothetical protein